MEILNQEDKNRICEAIKIAELNTTGELRLYFDTICEDEVLDRAAWVFDKLGMDKKKHRNAVLFYIVISQRKIAIIGDKGINDVVNDDFWEKRSMELKHCFAKGNYAQGLECCILRIGEVLKTHFPYSDKEEISYDEFMQEQQAQGGRDV